MGAHMGGGQGGEMSPLELENPIKTV